MEGGFYWSESETRTSAVGENFKELRPHARYSNQFVIRRKPFGINRVIAIRLARTLNRRHYERR